jgi:hypothetical protein
MQREWLRYVRLGRVIDAMDIALTPTLCLCEPDNTAACSVGTANQDYIS